jgi:hypothetical protein
VCDDVTRDMCQFVAPDCDKSCMAFKQCAERGPWSHLLHQAFMAWNAGDMCEMMRHVCDAVTCDMRDDVTFVR